MTCVVAIVGPTGIGKSKLALRFARAFRGEIVSADSRQVYRHMDIGTAKPDRRERSLAPHHLIDIVNPDENFSLARYQALAYQAIRDIQKRRKLPLLVGGSGLYVWAVVEGWSIPPIAPDPVLRRSMEEEAASMGAERLYQELARADPAAARRIDPRNTRRVIRALEVHRKTPASVSRLRDKKPPPFDTLVIGLTADRAALYRRIDSRVDDMIEKGLVEEVESLVRMGYDFGLPAMSGIGYKQIGKFLKGELSLAAATQQIKFETHRFVRHQYAWFKLTDDRIHWFDTTDRTDTETGEIITRFLENERLE